MRTQIMVENLMLQLLVLDQMKELFQQLDEVHDCWCKYRTWNIDRKVAFIKKACELLGIIGQEERFSLLIGDLKKSPGGMYSECLTWEKFFQACCLVKKQQ